jgi:hypothetical protein
VTPEMRVVRLAGLPANLIAMGAVRESGSPIV